MKFWRKNKCLRNVINFVKAKEKDNGKKKKKKTKLNAQLYTIFGSIKNITRNGHFFLSVMPSCLVWWCVKFHCCDTFRNVRGRSSIVLLKYGNQPNRQIKRISRWVFMRLFAFRIYFGSVQKRPKLKIWEAWKSFFYL